MVPLKRCLCLLVIFACIVSINSLWYLHRKSAKYSFFDCFRLARQCPGVKRWQIRSYCKHECLRNKRSAYLLLLHRQKRQTASCATEIYVRKEVRLHSPAEWSNFTNALNALKNNGIYDLLAAIHRGGTVPKAHGGPNFLGWHRLYLILMEYYLQEENPCVSLPYWYSSLDDAMEMPNTTILFSETFVGNGHGVVNTGPFANWQTGLGENLMRNIGSGGSLIRKEFVDRVLSRTKHSEITNNTDTFYSIENYHNGPHVWVDGQMILLNEAAEDPVFWMHHAFIDCWWQRFIEKNDDGTYQWPYNDYPSVTGRHAGDNDMDPFSYYTNRDGYDTFFYEYFYRCKPFPSCSSSNQDCGSPYLQCDTSKWQCVSVAAKKRKKRAGRRKDLSRLRIPLGRKFKSFYKDPRDTGAPLRQARMKLKPSPDYRRLNIEGFERSVGGDRKHTTTRKFNCRDVKNYRKRRN